MNEKKTVKIPRQIRLKTEFFIGFGMEELIKTLITGAISGIIAYIFYKVTGQTIIATLIVIGALVVAVISLIKGNNNFSMVDTIKNIIKYQIMQKDFRYERGDFNNKVISKK
ncbi:MAG: PrgI family protein [Clostridia bacterium]|nr:PrgI family protein [Clostridia bacterium]